MTRYRNHIWHDGAWWRCKIKIKAGPGKWTARKGSFPTRRLAEAWVETQYAARDGLLLAAEPELGPTVRQILTDYRRRCVALGRAPGTLRYYDQMIEQIERCMGPERDVASLVESDIFDYVRLRRDNQGGEHRMLRELGLLRASCRAAGIPMTWRLPDLRPASSNRRILSDLEAGRLWLAVEHDEVSRPAVALALLAGLRPAEVLDASTDWVDLSAAVLRVIVRKTHREAATAIVPTLADVIRGAPQGRLVRATETALRHRLWRRSQTAGIVPPLTGTARLRPTCATWAREAGYSQEDVAEILSHHKPGVTFSYLHAEAVSLKRKMLLAVEARLLKAVELARAAPLPKPADRL